MGTVEEAINLLDLATTIIYNTEGDLYQEVYEQLENIITKLKGEVNGLPK